MAKFNRIHIGGFRRLVDVDLEMRALMVLIGANGSGKTSLLDAISLLAASANKRLNSKLSEYGGFSSVANRHVFQDLVLGFQFEFSGADLVPGSLGAQLIRDYTLQLGGQRSGYTIERELLCSAAMKSSYLDRTGNQIEYSRNWPDSLARKTILDEAESALSQFSGSFAEYDAPRGLLSTVEHYHRLDTSPRSPIRLPQALKPVTSPGPNGESLVSFLFSLKESHPDQFESIEYSIKSGFDRFNGFGFYPVASGTMGMNWKEGATKFDLSELSEGTLRFLWLVSMLSSSSKPSLLMIDEPEISLHPELLSLFAALLRQASMHSQIIVATQSDSLVRFLEPKEIVVMDLQEDGSAKATWADSMDLDGWLSDYTLDQVWRMGRMGGRS